MKLMIFYHAMGEHGGGARIYAQMASAWAERGYDVTIVNHYGKAESIYPINEKVKIRKGLFNFVPKKFLRSLFSPLTFFKLLKAVIKEKPDILIINNGPYYGLINGMLVAKITGTKSIIWKHSGYFYISSPMYKISRNIFFRFADYIVTLTKGDKEFALKLNKNVEAIPNPYTPIVKKYEENHDQNIALTVGRLVKTRSVHLLIEAWKKARIMGWKLYIVGDGDYKSELEKMAAGDESILFIGATNDVDKYYSMASFFVISTEMEGFGLVLTEAMGYGLPLISFDCPFGPGEIIEEGKNGFLVENSNVDALAKAMVKMASSSEMRKKIAQNAPSRLKKFSMDTILNQWDELFQKLGY